ncbi:hypothetical protein ASC78_08580 [Variovorax sp. Root318D1]|nr:hypothetical protein ASC78_08580 [Variovorax sp. Root318D1]
MLARPIEHYMIFAFYIDHSESGASTANNANPSVGYPAIRMIVPVYTKLTAVGEDFSEDTRG